VTNPYATRLIWPTKGRTQYDIESARSRARNLQLRLEEMIMFKHAPLDIWRTAVQCRALAIVGDDRVTADNAREIADRFARPKRYSPAQRRAIHDKALAVLARLTPASNGHKTRHHKSNHHKPPWMSVAEQRRVRAWLARKHKER
jgi:hypothetical protein